MKLNNKILNKVLILLIIFPFYGYAFERELEIFLPNRCGSICETQHPSRRDGFGELLHHGHKYQGNFENFYIEGHGELEFNFYAEIGKRGDYYRGNFSKSSLTGIGVYLWRYDPIWEGNVNHKYFGSFKNDYLSGSGVYLSPDWIVNGKFAKDRLKHGNYNACNRADGTIYIAEAYTQWNIFNFSPNKIMKEFVPNQREVIRETKEKLTQLYYYKGPINGKCNGNLFNAIIEFYKDEESETFAIDILSKEFFIKNITSIKFQTMLNSAITRVR